MSQFEIEETQAQKPPSSLSYSPEEDPNSSFFKEFSVSQAPPNLNNTTIEISENSILEDEENLIKATVDSKLTKVNQTKNSTESVHNKISSSAEPIETRLFSLTPGEVYEIAGSSTE